ncbi:alpha/beta hydrolase [Streptomyces sp. NBC_00343]|uniref:alpha/beta hydrolase n=1 Tax=Streptomyces sp. NBC_00343 TaxID=2975719 RepID=UPI002E296834|nr:alpha/beta hydrolase [Streptomyces sp. NBC_00343]
MQDWEPLVPAVAQVWPRTAEFLHDPEFERFETQVLIALRGLDAARQSGGEHGSPEAVHAAALNVVAAFEEHDPLGALLASEFADLVGRPERFGPEDPPPDWIPWQRALLIPVLYATDRAAVTKPSGETGFGAESGDLSYGELRVSVPDEHQMGAAEKPRWWRLGWRPDPAKTVVPGVPTLLPAEEFAQLTRTRLADGADKALIFVHGYNVPFADAAVRAAQIAYDLNFTGVTLLYSWPSQGTLSGYAADGNAAARAVPAFREFLRHLLTRTGADEVHLIAHSMGNRLLLDALADFDTAALGPDSGSLGQVFFAAPDVDAEVFRQRLPRIVPQTRGCTLYASRADRALAASASLARNPRAGQCGEEIIVAPGLDTIDVSALGTGLLGHSYVGDHRSILGDIHALLRHGLPVSQRFGLVPAVHPDGRYWIFRP